MRKIYAIAVNTFKEAIRDRILYLFLVFALLMILCSRIISLLTIGSEEKIIKDLGISAINVFSVLIAVFVGVGLVFKEIEKKTIYTVVSKPIKRYQFIIGKYFGLVVTILINMVIMTLFFYLLLAVQGYFDPSLGNAIFLTFFEVLIITAFALLFSSFSTPILSAIFTISFYVIGHLSWSFLLLKNYIEGEWGKAVCSILYVIVPNLEYFNIRGDVVHRIPIDGSHIFYAAGYGIGWSVVLLIIAGIIFQRKNFN